MRLPELIELINGAPELIEGVALQLEQAEDRCADVCAACPQRLGGGGRAGEQVAVGGGRAGRHSTGRWAQPANGVFPVTFPGAASPRRVRFLACCRRLWRLEPGMASVWRDFKVEVRSEAAAQALLRWVHARRHRLWRVELSTEDLEEGEVDGNQALYVASLLGGAPVEELWLTPLAGSFQLGSWLTAAAPQLRELEIECGGSIAVRPSFSLLTGLTCLKLLGKGGSLEMAPGCLPPSLREALLVPAPPTLLEGSLTAAAPSLKSCSLWAMGGDFSWAVLPRFTALTRLSLGSADLDAAPAELAALTGLQELRIFTSPLRDAAALAPLAALTRLTRLEFDGTNVGARLVVPEGVLRLPRLKVRRCLLRCPSFAFCSCLLCSRCPAMCVVLPGRDCGVAGRG